MERLSGLRRVIILLALLLLIEIGFLIVQFVPRTFIAWTTVAMIVIVALYLTRISLGLIKELGKSIKDE